MAPSSLPVVSGDKDQLLQQALGRLAASPQPGGPDADADRHGDPPAAGGRGELRAVPGGGGSAAEGGARGARHRAALHAPGRGVRARARRAQRRHDHADGVGQDALLQRAGARRDPEGPVRRARCISFRPRRSRRISSRSCTRWPSSSAERLQPERTRLRRSASSPTTATRRRTRGARSAARRTSSSAIPTCCTRASCRTIRAGRSCSRT